MVVLYGIFFLVWYLGGLFSSLIGVYLILSIVNVIEIVCEDFVNKILMY